MTPINQDELMTGETCVRNLRWLIVPCWKYLDGTVSQYSRIRRRGYSRDKLQEVTSIVYGRQPEVILGVRWCRDPWSHPPSL